MRWFSTSSGSVRDDRHGVSRIVVLVNGSYVGRSEGDAGDR